MISLRKFMVENEFELKNIRFIAIVKVFMKEKSIIFI